MSEANTAKRNFREKKLYKNRKYHHESHHANSQFRVQSVDLLHPWNRDIRENKRYKIKKRQTKEELLNGCAAGLRALQPLIILRLKATPVSKGRSSLGISIKQESA